MSASSPRRKEWTMKRTAWSALALALAGIGTAAAEADAGPAAAAADGPAVVELRGELAELRGQVRRLQDSLDGYMRTVLTYHEAENERLRFKVRQLARERDFLTRELESENERLRRHVRQLYRDHGVALPPVPTPDRGLIEEVLEGASTPLGAAPPSWPAAGAALPPQPTYEVDCQVVAEMGRTPEEAAALGDGVPSLKGMICCVPPDVGEEYLAALGRTIRAQLDPYDNINVEVFDDLDAARSFHEKHVAQPKHRVLSISRHRASGRDVILRVRGDDTEVIPYEE